MIKISKNPIYTIDVYEGSIKINNEIFDFTIDSGDSYAEIKWNIFGTDGWKKFKKLLEKQESFILEDFEKMMWENK